MNNVEEIFDKDTVNDISQFVEEKMEILKQIPEFKQMDEKLSTVSLEIVDKLPEIFLKNYNDFLKLSYKVDKYYFTLAFFLGAKFSNKIKVLNF